MRVLLGLSLSQPPYSPGKILHRQQWISGLQRLGCEVLVMEELESGLCYDAQGRRVDFRDSANAELFGLVAGELGIEENSTLLVDGVTAIGRSIDEFFRRSPKIDLLLNWSGHLKTPSIFEKTERSVYLDLDPVFTQLWHSVYGVDLGFGRHDSFVSVGLNIGTRATDIPDCGIEWNHTLPPVLLDSWKVEAPRADAPFTTIASLRSYPDLSFRGVNLGSKLDELSRIAPLPQKVSERFELALSFFTASPPEIQSLVSAGWSVSDAAKLTDPTRYRRFIAESKGEIGLVQSAYRVAKSGWFSDRWSHYLASGRPVVAAATGFEQHLPCGEGLLKFDTVAEAAEAVAAVSRDLSRHSRAARAFAEEFLDSNRVLTRLLDRCLD